MSRRGEARPGRVETMGTRTIELLPRPIHYQGLAIFLGVLIVFTVSKSAQRGACPVSPPEGSSRAGVSQVLARRTHEFLFVKFS